jgi:hypothetical protein
MAVDRYQIYPFVPAPLTVPQTRLIIRYTTRIPTGQVFAPAPLLPRIRKPRE